jgi:hypothetical protein
VSAFKNRPGAAAATPAKRPAPKVVELPPCAWADTFAKKPAGPVRVGLRRIADGDMRDAREQAAKIAWKAHPQPLDEELRIEAFNDALVLWIVSRATCKPEDVLATFWAMPQDEIPEQLTTQGQRQLYDAFEELKLEDSPLEQEAGAEDIERLAVMLSAGGAAIASSAAPRTKRLLRHCLMLVDQLFGGDSAAMPPPIH